MLFNYLKCYLTEPGIIPRNNQLYQPITPSVIEASTNIEIKKEGEEKIKETKKKIIYMFEASFDDPILEPDKSKII